MTKRSDLFTDQDIHAFADGQIEGERLEALVQHMDAKPVKRAQASSYLALNEALMAHRDEIYQHDPALSAAIMALSPS